MIREKNLKFGKWLVISSHALPGLWLLIHAGIKIIHDTKGTLVVCDILKRPQSIWQLYVEINVH